MSASPEHQLNLPNADYPRPRPPWAIAEWAFAGRCDGCLACVDACREGLLQPDPAGLPEVDFRFGACDFCGACVTACDRGALRRDLTAAAPAFRFVISIDQTCLAGTGEPCDTCAEFCEGYAIRFQFSDQGQRIPVVLSASCNGCGACVGPCPVNAIHLTRILPPAWR